MCCESLLSWVSDTHTDILIRIFATNYLVDPASSHMLVSKIKPCMSKNKPLNGESANGSLNQLLFIWWYLTTWITVVILELIHASSPDFGKGAFIRFKPSARLGNWARPLMVSHNNLANRMALSRRCFIQISALSAFDGRILAYHGYNG